MYITPVDVQCSGRDGSWTMWNRNPHSDPTFFVVCLYSSMPIVWSWSWLRSFKFSFLVFERVCHMLYCQERSPPLLLKVRIVISFLRGHPCVIQPEDMLRPLQWNLDLCWCWSPRPDLLSVFVLRMWLTCVLSHTSLFSVFWVSWRLDCIGIVIPCSLGEAERQRWCPCQSGVLCRCLPLLVIFPCDRAWLVQQ